MDIISYSTARNALREAQRRQPQRVPIAARAQPPIHTSMSDGTEQSALFVMRPQVLIDAHSLRITYGNFYNDAGTGLGSYELPNPSDLSIYATLVDAANIRTAIIPGGAVLRPGEVTSWDLPVEVAAGSTPSVWTQVWVDALGMRWPRGVKINRTGEGKASAQPGFNDLTGTLGSGSIAYAATNAYGPAVISGIPKDGPVASVLGIGDSIMYGIGSGTGNATNDKGFFPEALTAANICHLNIGMGSSTAAAFADPAKRRGRMACVQDLSFTHAVWEFATNDLGFSIAAQKSNALTGWKVLATRGIKVYALTCCPHTNNAAGTIPGANESKRVEYNDWLRDGAPISYSTGQPVAIGTSADVLRATTHPGIGASSSHPLWGGPDGTDIKWDLADAVEDGRNSGIWKSGYTDDGVHPSNSGHIAAQTCINTAAFVA